jgi:hypothetical protein
MIKWQNSKGAGDSESLNYSRISPSICAYVCKPDAIRYLRTVRQNVAALLPIAPPVHSR